MDDFLQDINFNRSIKDALAFEEKFFSTLPVCPELMIFLTAVPSIVN
jgi:hypothetical protein